MMIAQRQLFQQEGYPSPSSPQLSEATETMPITETTTEAGVVGVYTEREGRTERGALEWSEQEQQPDRASRVVGAVSTPPPAASMLMLEPIHEDKQLSARTHHIRVVAHIHHHDKVGSNNKSTNSSSSRNLNHHLAVYPILEETTCSSTSAADLMATTTKEKETETAVPNKNRSKPTENNTQHPTASTSTRRKNRASRGGGFFSKFRRASSGTPAHLQSPVIKKGNRSSSSCYNALFDGSSHGGGGGAEQGAHRWDMDQDDMEDTIPLVHHASELQTDPKNMMLDRLLLTTPVHSHLKTRMEDFFTASVTAENAHPDAGVARHIAVQTKASSSSEPNQLELDAVLDSNTATPTQLYEATMGDMVQRTVLRGYNLTVVCTGDSQQRTVQGMSPTSSVTSSKGNNHAPPKVAEVAGQSCNVSLADQDGLWVRGVHDLFQGKDLYAQTAASVHIRMSCVELVQDQVHDVMPLPNEQPKTTATTDEAATERPSQRVASLQEALSYMEHARQQRKRHREKASSSRQQQQQQQQQTRAPSGHMITTFTVTVQPTQCDSRYHAVKQTVATLTLVELDPESSPPTSLSSNSSQHDRDWHALERLISTRGNNRSPNHSPTASQSNSESTLARFLHNALGGNSFCVWIASVSSSFSRAKESWQTLEFAERVRDVVNSVRKNMLDVPMTPGECAAMRAENKQLKAKLEKVQSKLRDSVVVSQALEASASLLQLHAGDEKHSIASRGEHSTQQTKIKTAQAEEECARENALALSVMADSCRERISDTKVSLLSEPTGDGEGQESLVSASRELFQDDGAWGDFRYSGTGAVVASAERDQLQSQVDALREEKDALSKELFETRNEMEEMRAEQTRSQDRTCDSSISVGSVKKRKAETPIPGGDVAKILEQCNIERTMREEAERRFEALSSEFETVKNQNKSMKNELDLLRRRLASLDTAGQKAGDSAGPTGKPPLGKPSKITKETFSRGSALSTEALQEDREPLPTGADTSESRSSTQEKTDSVNSGTSTGSKYPQVESSETSATEFSSTESILEHATNQSGKGGDDNTTPAKVNESLATESPAPAKQDRSEHDEIKSHAEKMLTWADQAIEHRRASGSNSVCSSIVSSNGTDFRPNTESRNQGKPPSGRGAPSGRPPKCPTKPPVQSSQPHVVIANMDQMTQIEGFCTCESSLFSGNVAHVEFFLPKLGITCSCGKKKPVTIVDGSDPLQLGNILRPWQVDFLASIGIQDAHTFVSACSQRSSVLAKLMRRWRKQKRMAPVRTSSCSVALHIWSRTCKSVIQTVRDQQERGEKVERPSFLQVNLQADQRTVSTLGFGSVKSGEMKIESNAPKPRHRS